MKLEIGSCPFKMLSEIGIVKAGKGSFATASRGMYELSGSNVNAHMQGRFFFQDLKKNKIPGLNCRF